MVATRILELTGGPGDKAAVAEAAAAIRSGMLVVFPTETVYGLGCNALDREAVARLYAAKGRSWSKPLALYVASAEALGRYVDRVPEQAAALARRFWPGPLTMLLPQRGGKGRVGFRCPDEARALALIDCCGTPLAAASANRSGNPPPLSGEEAAAAMEGLADVVLKGGETRWGKESTIVDVGGAEPVIVREGALGRAEVESVLRGNREGGCKR